MTSDTPGRMILPPEFDYADPDPEIVDALVLRPQPQAATFRCPVCHKTFRHNMTGMPPVCTGPHPSLDEHPPEPMVQQP